MTVPPQGHDSADRREFPMLRILFSATLLIVLLLLAGCTSSDSGSSANNEIVEVTYNLEIPNVSYQLNRDAGDPSVSAEDGGPGFTGEGWETNLEFPAIGSSEAVKGGSLSTDILDWPATLRMGGQNWNTSLNYLVRDLCFPALIQQHPVTLQFIPGIASHWKISDDKMTYQFRINPKAKWSDGTPVTAEDYVASYNLWLDPTILFPSNQVVYGKFAPRALSRYILEIQCSEENWRNLLYSGGMVILPAKEIEGLTGTEYLDRYQFAYTSFCGPYQVSADDIEMNRSVTLTRNPDWWDADNPAWTGLYNIDEIRNEVVKEAALVYEKAKRGELDYYVIPRAKWFASDLPKEDVCIRGLLVRHKIFNDSPIGTSGIAMNRQRFPLGDVRMRKAISHLFDRDTMIEKLFFDEYEKLNSYWQGGTYGNPNNVRVEYDELAADELLNEMGYTERNNVGFRTKDGKTLELDLMYRSKQSEIYLTIIQESFERLGIKLNLKLLTPSTFWKNLQEKEYELAMMNWSALVIPNPETSWKSTLAQEKNNNNVTAFESERVDELLIAYDREYDIQKRRQIIREIDGIIYNEHPYALGWYKPAQRVVFANKFSWPEWGTSRTYRDTQQLIYVWWVDPEKEKALEQARKDSAMKLEIPPLENRFWPQWNAAQEAKGSL